MIERSQRLNLATFAGTPQVGEHLRPTSVSAVRDCVLDAARRGRKLHPISTGKNWGYGSATPSEPADILDLGAMDAILDYDPELGVVVVEPGVTQGQLADFLKSQGDLHWMDPAGAARDVSIVGNTLERGFGHTSYADHWQNVMWIEVVLADGSILRSGFAGHRDAVAANAFRWGAGPMIDGLFSQSNLGVVTRMALALMPRPECFAAAFFASRDEQDLEAIVDGMRVLRQGHFVPSAAHIVNDLKVFQSFGQYPWQQMQGKTPLDEDLRRDLRKAWGVSAWNGSAALYGTRRHVAESKARMKRLLGPSCSRLAFVSAGKLALVKSVAPALKRAGLGGFTSLIARLDPVMGLMSGQPTDAILDSVYWRKKTPPPARPDPDRDRCGLIWIPPVAPLKGRHARLMADITTAVFARHGFEPSMSMTAITERALDNVICLSFDRDVEGEDQRALTCYDETTAALAQAGYYPYRTHPTGFDHGAWTQTERITPRLRAMLDPHGIFAARG